MAAKFIYETDSLSLDRNSLVLNETIFHNANGYIGIRSNFEEGYPDGFDSIRGSYINGFYDIAEMKQAEKLYGFVEEKETMLNVADTQGIRVSLDGEEFSMFEGTVQSSRRKMCIRDRLYRRKPYVTLKVLEPVYPDLSAGKKAETVRLKEEVYNNMKQGLQKQ